MKKYNLTKILGILGVLIWASTILLRETSATTIPLVGLFLGVAPNIGAVWVFTSIVEEVYPKIAKRDYNHKVTVVTLICIFILGLGSEVVHDLFLNSPFDIYDIIATVISSIIYLISARVKNEYKINSIASKR